MNRIKIFEENGYIVLKNLFSASEIEALRNDVYKQFEKDKAINQVKQVGKTDAFIGVGDILSKDHISRVIMDKRIIDVCKEILHSDQLVYFKDSSYQIGSGLRGWHRDNVDREFNIGDDWSGDYTIIRMGIYMQNHKDYSGGLKVKAGSHKSSEGKIQFIDNEVGDLTLWNLRTVHSGNAVRLKMMPNLSLNHLENYVPSFLKKKEQLERVSMFITFGVRSNHLDNYLKKYFFARPENQAHIANSIISEEKRNTLNSMGIELVETNLI